MPLKTPLTRLPQRSGLPAALAPRGPAANRLTPINGSTGTSGAVINPDTGQIVSGGGPAGGAGAVAVSTQLAAYRQQGMNSLLGPLVVIELLGVLAVPPVVYLAIRRRRRAAP